MINASFSVMIIDDNKMEDPEEFNLIIDPHSLNDDSITTDTLNMATVIIMDNEGK